MKTIRTLIDSSHMDTAELQAGDLIFDLRAKGRFWRTAPILGISFIRADGVSLLYESLISEKEADEYDLLTSLIPLLAQANRIISFNGTAFDLPFLRNKLKAYGLGDPLSASKKYTDLFLELKSFSRLFALPARRLNDYVFWMDDGASVKGSRSPSYGKSAEASGSPAINLNSDDAFKTLRILSCTRYTESLRLLSEDAGSICSLHKAGLSGERLFYEVDVPFHFPKEASLHDGEIHLIFRNDRLLFALPIREEKLKIYHSDLQNYEYLPAEGYAVHKSTASFVDKSRREPAKRETCFHYARFQDEFLEDGHAFRTLIRSVCRYLLSV